MSGLQRFVPPKVNVPERRRYEERGRDEPFGSAREFQQACLGPFAYGMPVFQAQSFFVDPFTGQLCQQGVVQPVAFQMSHNPSPPKVDILTFRSVPPTVISPKPSIDYGAFLLITPGGQAFVPRKDGILSLRKQEAFGDGNSAIDRATTFFGLDFQIVKASSRFSTLEHREKLTNKRYNIGVFVVEPTTFVGIATHFQTLTHDCELSLVALDKIPGHHIDMDASNVLIFIRDNFSKLNKK